jgi:hypothetical protein
MDVQSTSLLLLLGELASATKQREDVEQSERLRAAVCIVLEFWLMDAVCPYVQSLSFSQ